MSRQLGARTAANQDENTRAVGLNVSEDTNLMVHVLMQ